MTLAILLQRTVTEGTVTVKSIADALAMSNRHAYRWVDENADRDCERMRRVLCELPADARCLAAAELLRGTGLQAIPADIDESELDRDHNGRIDADDLADSECETRDEVQRLSVAVRRATRDRRISDDEQTEILRHANAARRGHRRTAAIAERIAFSQPTRRKAVAL